MNIKENFFNQSNFNKSDKICISLSKNWRDDYQIIKGFFGIKLFFAELFIIKEFISQNFTLLNVFCVF